MAIVLKRAAQVAAVTLVVSLLALLIWKTVTTGSGTRLVHEVSRGKKPRAPAFRLAVLWPHSETWPPRLRRALSDGHVNVRELRGYPVVVNFWASWCGPCKDEAPRLTASARTHAGHVAFLGIDVQDFKSDARGFLRRFHTNYVSVRDNGGETYDGYGLTGVPETFWIDGRGRIVSHYAGEISRRQLEDGIRLAATES